MKLRSIPVPVSLLLDPGLPASAKVVGMALLLDPAASPADLEWQTGLTRRTVLRGLGRLKAAQQEPGKRKVRVPNTLLADLVVSPQAKVLYGVLQATPNFWNNGGQFTYTALCDLVKMSRKRVKRVVAELAESGWVRISQTCQLSPVDFTLSNPELARQRIEEFEEWCIEQGEFRWRRAEGPDSQERRREVH